MISKLTIKNFAIIKHIEICFKDGFSKHRVKLGTKSIMIDAAKNINGQRSTKDYYLIKILNVF